MLHSAMIQDGYHFFMNMLLVTYEWIIFIIGLLSRRGMVLAFICVIY